MHIFADGASKGNPGPGGWGAIVSAGGRVVELGGKEEHTTNNRMELTAAIEALACARGFATEGRIVFHTDSAYVINGITKWVTGWQARSWVTQKKEPVLNRDLWERLVLETAPYARRIEWVHVGGHVGVAGNERADAIASGFAEGKPPSLFAGSRADYPLALEDTSHDATKVSLRRASRTRSSAKAYSYVSKVGGEVQVHKTWAECEARVRGKQARFKKATTPAEEAALVQEFSQ